MRGILVALLIAGIPLAAAAKPLSVANMLALHGLAGFSALGGTDAGKAALQSNLSITHAIQTGAAGLPGLQSFALQQQQALRDASITFNNGRELADGLGSKLGPHTWRSPITPRRKPVTRSPASARQFPPM